MTRKEKVQRSHFPMILPHFVLISTVVKDYVLPVQTTASKVGGEAAALILQLSTPLWGYIVQELPLANFLVKTSQLQPLLGCYAIACQQ